MDGLAELVPFVQLGAAGVLLGAIFWAGRYFIRLVSSGEWVPKRELDYLRADRDARLKEKDAEISEWRAAYETERTAREVAVDHARDLTSGFSTVSRTLDALRARAEETRRVEGP